MDVDRLFGGEQIFLVVGATNNDEYGSRVFLNLRGAGYHVVAINHRAAELGEVHDTPVYATITAFLERIEDLFDEKRRHDAIKKAVLVIPPDAARRVLEEAVGLGVTTVWFQPGSESDEALAYCRSHDIAFVANECIMSYPKA